jgi:hypothetical protein
MGICNMGVAFLFNAYNISRERNEKSALLSMTTSVESDHVLFINGKQENTKKKNNFYRKWWNQDYEHQRYIYQIIEQNYFYKITILLLICDCIFVICQAVLDFAKVKSECLSRNQWFIARHKHEIDIVMKVLHYLSISILTLFVVELFIKLYVFGNDFWNIHKRKMEYFDGFIVLFSFYIDIYFLINEDHYFMEYKFQMMTSIRIWRFIRIINCKNFSLINFY